MSMCCTRRRWRVSACCSRSAEISRRAADARSRFIRGNVMNAPAAEIPTTNKRKRGFAILGATVAVAGALYGAYWFFSARFYESTDDSRSEEHTSELQS